MYPITNNVTSQQIQSSPSLGDNQQAITAVEQMEQTAAQLEALLNQTPPNQKAIINCYNQLASQWNAFSTIPITNPSMLVELAKDDASLCIDTTKLGIDIGDFPGASQMCQDVLESFNQLIFALQNGVK